MKTLMYKFLGWFLRILIRLIGRTIYRLKIRGIKNIPSEGGALLVANHASYMDFVLVVSSVNRYVSFVMNADVYNKPSLRWILKGLNCIPISPRGGKNNFEEFNEAVSTQVNAGNVVVIFAEGTVTRTGQLLEFKKGVEHLSTMIHAPVIPIHFHNVQGTPFTFRAGRNRIEKLSWKSFRREVLVNIGNPIHNKIPAFLLRQRIKELEVENFDYHLRNIRPIDELLREQLGVRTTGSWKCGGNKILFSDLNKKLAELDSILLPLVKNETRVGLLLPKDDHCYLINLWLILNKKTVININPQFSNEERFYVVKRSGISTLITTIDLEFSRFSPNAEKIIYLEHLQEAIETGKKVHVICKRINLFSKKVLTFFSRSTNPEEAVTIMFERQKNVDELKCISINHRQIMSVILGLKQVYHFEEGKHMMSNLPMYHAFGFVLEFLQPLLYGLHVEIVDENISAQDFTTTLEETKPSLVIATPSQLNAIAALSQIKNLPYLTQIFTADLHPQSHDINLLGERGIDVYVCAGMNETSSVFAVNLKNYQGRDIAGKMMQQENEHEGTIGKPLPGVALKVCDHNMAELPHEETGRIWIKSACVTAPMNSEDYCKPVLVDGWFDSGLNGSINHKGFVMLSA